MRSTIFIFLYLITMSGTAQELLKFSIGSDQYNCPVSVSLDQVNYNTDENNLVLFELVKGNEIQVPCQIETGHSAKLWFILSEKEGKYGKRNFVLRQSGATNSEKGIELKKDREDLTLTYDGKPILSYRHAVTFPPKGVDPNYKRSGYVHPVVSPEGEVLTKIQPEDHYHHYGIWGSWTKTHIDGREVDFWNLKKGLGTVKFAGFLSEVEGAVFSGFKALQKHIDFGAKGADQIALNEVLDVRAWNIGEKMWLLDYTITLNSPLDSGILFDAYRYGGGIGFRATEKWHKDNCTVLTSEGKDRKEADGSNARWCLVEGESETKSGRSGVLFMSYPANRMHPEPMRVWPLDGNGGRGDMFFEFCPIRHNEWKIENGKDYSLKYRMLIFDGELTTREAEQYWKAFAMPPVIDVKN